MGCQRAFPTAQHHMSCVVFAEEEEGPYMMCAEARLWFYLPQGPGSTSDQQHG